MITSPGLCMLEGQCFILLTSLSKKTDKILDMAKHMEKTAGDPSGYRYTQTYRRLAENPAHFLTRTTADLLV